jgi:hypothetical protein
MNISEQRHNLLESYYTAINKLDEEIGVLEMRKRQVSKEYEALLHDLQQDCLVQHGSHEDDGAFMHGNCKRCNAHLG